MRWDEFLPGKHPEFLGYSVHVPIVPIIFNATIALVSVRMLLCLLIHTALIPLLLLQVELEFLQISEVYPTQHYKGLLSIAKL